MYHNKNKWMDKYANKVSPKPLDFSPIKTRLEEIANNLKNLIDNPYIRINSHGNSDHFFLEIGGRFPCKIGIDRKDFTIDILLFEGNDSVKKYTLKYDGDNYIAEDYISKEDIILQDNSFEDSVETLISRILLSSVEKSNN